MAENLASSKILEHISIVIIDHDTASVASLTSILQQFSKYVMNVDVASKALSLIEEQDIGLVIANVEMPHIDSHTFIITLLQNHIPLILLNPEMQTQKTSGLLTKEACYYLNKPVSENDIKNMWQHVLLKMSQEAQELKKPNTTKQQDNVQIVDLRKSFKRQRTTQASETYQETRVIANDTLQYCLFDNNLRRRCTVWTEERHNNFLSVISILGDKNSVPKSILKLMNDPNLNYHQVASHLQKYRAKVKQISDSLSRKNLIECNPWLDSLTQNNSSSSSIAQYLSNHSLFGKELNNTLRDPSYAPWSPSYVLPETQKSLVSCEISNAALVNVVTPQHNIEEKNYNPIEDTISFDIDKMDMHPWLENSLGHDFACNNLMEDHDISMELGSARPQHNMMESCDQYQNIEATNQREGFNFDNYRDCINWIEEMMNKDETG